MINIQEQIAAAKKGFAYVLFAGRDIGGKPTIAITKGKRFEFAMYRDNVEVRRTK